jgi:hypothetical protein
LTIPYSTCQKSANLGRVRQSSGGGEIPIWTEPIWNWRHLDGVSPINMAII